MVAPRRYKAVGTCIYCGSQQSWPQRLGDEHIIARAFGGALILPEASCLLCGDITSGLETACLNGMLSAAKPHFGIKSGSNGVSTHLPMTPGRQFANKRLVHHSDHPSIMIMFTFQEPGILCGRDPAQRHGAKFEFIELAPNYLSRLTAQGGQMAMNGVGAAPFGRMLAKVAYSFAVAELGLDGFRPLILETIKGTSPLPIAHFVGERMPIQRPSDQMHEIGLMREARASQPDLWVVRTRLFATRKTPTYDIVVGEVLATEK